MINKEMYSVFTTDSGNCYYYDVVQQIFSPLHSIQKYIIDNYLMSGKFDVNGIKSDDSLKKFKNSEVDYYLDKLIFLKKNGFFFTQAADEITIVKYNETDVRDSFASSNQICFEVTEKCNLGCKYCIYGNYYNHYSHRDGLDMSFEIARTLIDYKVERWFSDSNNSAKITKLISFYGGEPLLNFKLIEKIVSYTKNLGSSTGIKFMYNMTTNGVLLNKYSDFLIENNFFISISLDGDELHNQYRIFPNGLPSFNTVINNIEQLKSKNRLFFERSVIFNSVLHHKSNISSIDQFFKEKFNKSMLASTINPISNHPELNKLIGIGV